MRECKKCKLVKGDSKFHKIKHLKPMWTDGLYWYETTWLCKECKKEIEERAGQKALNKKIAKYRNITAQ